MKVFVTVFQSLSLSPFFFVLSVEIPLPSWMGLAGLPWQFSAVQLHLHWGNGVGVATGSEHSIDDQSASAEVCVCVCDKWGNL